MDGETADRLRAAYDAVADEYVRRIFDELDHKPLDRALLDRFADAVRDAGPACDLGCGPGHVARYLHGRGVRVTGIDFSGEMIRHARALTPEVEFRQGDLRALDVRDGTWAGIAAFYSLIHVPPEELVAVLSELRRTLRPGGLLLAAFHVGEEVLHLDEWWGRTVSADFHFFTSRRMAGAMRAAGFTISGAVERDPYPEVEHPSRRGYIFSRAPSPPAPPAAAGTARSGSGSASG